MEVFLFRIRQLLPVLGSDILIPVAQPTAKQPSGGTLFCRIKGAEARGHRTPDGFVVLHGSTASFRSARQHRSVTRMLSCFENSFLQTERSSRETGSLCSRRIQNFLVPVLPQRLLMAAEQMASPNGRLRMDALSKNWMKRVESLWMRLILLRVQSPEIMPQRFNRD